MYISSHIAVFAWPFGTHAAPLLNFVRRLAASAPNVMFSFFSNSEANNLVFSGSKADEFDNIKAYDVWDGVPNGHVYSGDHQELVEFFVKALPHNLEKAMKEAEEKIGMKISCLLTDCILWSAGDIAEKLGVPWVAFWAASSAALSIHIYTDLIRDTVGAIAENGQKSKETLDFIPGLSAMHINDLTDEVLMDDSQWIMAFTFHHMGLKLQRATAVVLNCFEEMDPTITNDLKSKLQNVLTVGPLSLTASKIASNSDKEECLVWLKKQKHASVVYIAFGTVCFLPTSEMEALAEALEIGNIPFLWSMRNEERKHLPEGFFDRTCTYGKIVSWAPQPQVLAHSSVGAFVTHCGWNSILESISYGGVPMICRPFFADQKPNSRMVADVWKIGARVENGVFTKRGAILALELILSSGRGKEIKENARGLREKAFDAVKPNGSSTINFEALVKIIIATPKGTKTNTI